MHRTIRPFEFFEPESIDEAIRVGKRRQREPVILKIDAKRAWEEGIEFRKSSGIYLVKGLPPEYIYQ